MAFSFLNQELAIDLGTANTVIYQNDQIVLDEPSIIAIDNNTGKCIAFGQQAKLMHEKVNPGMKTIRPLRDGVIADFNAAEMMIRGFIKQATSRHKNIFSPNLKVVVGIPSGSTEVEIRAVRDSTEHAGGRDVYLIFEPMAAALGMGLDIEAPQGHMVVDIGGGTTEIAVISLGGLVQQESIRTAGDVHGGIQLVLDHDLLRRVGLHIVAGIVDAIVEYSNGMDAIHFAAIIGRRRVVHASDAIIARLLGALRIQMSLRQVIVDEEQRTVALIVYAYCRPLLLITVEGADLTIGNGHFLVI